MQPKIEVYRGRRLAVITVTPDDPDRIEQFWEEEGLPGEVVLDEGREIFDKYGVPGLPAGVLVDREGRAVDETLGWPDNAAEDWKEKVEQLLE